MADKKISKKSAGSDYGAESITVLEGLEPVRKRPGMYIGSTAAAGLHHLIWEVVDNGIDEAMAGFATEISVTLLDNGLVEVIDNGRGIPVGIHKQAKISALELVLTKLHAGGKFGDGGGYKVSGGLHGVGVSVVNALSEYLKAEVHREGKIWMQEYKRGIPIKKVKPVGNSKKTCTIITFKPDAAIFETLEFNWGAILDRLRQQAYLTKGITIKVADRRKNHSRKNYKFYFEGGIKAYVKSLNRSAQVKNETIFYVDKEINDSRVEVALQYNDGYNETVLAFANNIINPEGGTHVAGFRTALTRTLNSYARAQNFIKEKDENLTGEDVREGLTVIISVKLTNPQFEGQTKGKLGNSDIKTYVEQTFGDSFASFLQENPRQAEAIVAKCLLSAQARIAARTARASILRKGALEGMTLPGKLADCSSRKPEESELYIVEGDSAGGCWCGNTKVALIDGREISFKQLVKEHKQGKKNFCYTICDNGHIGVAPIINPRMTKRDAEVIEIILDNNEKLICTPDHKFRLIDGNYIPAAQLTPHYSLAPLYRKISKKEGQRTLDGYEMIFDPKAKKWNYTHVLSDIYNLANGVYTASAGKHRHHIDFNKRNNNPTNISRLPYGQHMIIHYKHLEHTLHRPDAIKKSIETKQTDEFRRKASMKSLEKRELFSQNAKKQWQDETYKKFMTQKFLEFYNSNADYRQKNNKLLNEVQKKYWGNPANKQAQAERVRQYFKKNPEAKKLLKNLAEKEWQDAALREWRSEETKKQWTDEFRKKRKIAYNKTYLNKALNTLRQIYENRGQVNLPAYEDFRRETNDKSLLKTNTILARFFHGDNKRLIEAVENYNHKIKKIVKLKERMDVYDLEVPGTHNFALASGVFVHNSAKQGRDRKFQAILPLRGKILNVERARLDKMLANNEIKNLVIALGANIDEQFDLGKLRYHRIIIMTDADVDGAHIRTLLLTLFYRHFNALVTNGNLYIAQPPLYQIKKGAAVKYAYSDEEKVKIIKEFGGGQAEVIETEASDEELAEENQTEEEIKVTKAKAAIRINIQRYKGLGEMNPVQLWDTTMNPQTRIMRQVNVDDAALANETFEMLMGGDVAPRKHFIQTHAKKVTNLDI
ncbi:MAG: DNA topoisomerase (ATP-hydrolyzing) subunit B [bacterium]|nr:DNA topoisomerase (ATP-hydrolyzing) subunit B [bacterium]